ncbi:MAG: EVE domain-containing protein [Thermoanaerobaculia bacterium]
MDWLVKSDPDEYSFQDLSREKRTWWSGVKNPTAVKHLASMKKGDRVIVYHTGTERSVVGLATVVADPKPDPENPKSVLVQLAAGAAAKKPITLDQIKANTLFAESPLVKIGRLSVVPLTGAQYSLLAKS